jgi:hypothetical protein
VSRRGKNSPPAALVFAQLCREALGVPQRACRAEKFFFDLRDECNNDLMFLQLAFGYSGKSSFYAERKKILDLLQVKDLIEI